ncbi:MAG: hypothetical protein MJ133_01775 [Lachnospiraceae bacterium]|nr:hypothetical protein [Lachnospiraceae bacterium]
MFKTINETDKFRYDDCVINEMIIDSVGISMSVDALIVKGDNSQNSNYTDSYAGTSQIEMKGASIIKIVKDGYKVYDANDVLIKEIPDEEMDINSEKWNIKFAGQYLTGIRRSDEETVFEIEMNDEEGFGVGDSFSVYIKCGDISICWEKYMNRVSY